MHSATPTNPGDQTGSVDWSRVARRVRVPLSFAFAVLYLWLARPTRTSILIGALVVIPGLVIRALASGYLQKNERLTIGGPYAYTRNPLYLGSLVLAAGFAIAARSWWIIGGMLAIFIGIYLPVIRAEEAFLGQQFPEFEAYASRVPRLFPRFSTLGNRGGAFSWELYRKHREYNAIFGTIFMLAILASKLLWSSN